MAKSYVLNYVLNLINMFKESKSIAYIANVHRMEIVFLILHRQGGLRTQENDDGSDEEGSESSEEESQSCLAESIIAESSKEFLQTKKI